MRKVISILLPFLPFSFLLLLQWALNVTIEEEMHQEVEENDDENYIKIALVEDKAYWIIDNVLYEADVIDGDIQKEYASPVDAFEMDYMEVNRLMHILDNIQDWKN